MGLDRNQGRRFQPPEVRMAPVKILAIILIVAGVIGLAYGTFTYTKETHTANVGPLTLSVKDKETVDIPLWASVGAIAVGIVLLVAGRNK
jgi:NADH:ubiquinone oxidoreductase subunit 5 (subunit L)/multisubunit Na+/H+ antiporter MnhA subunit